jgi:hypothetical protein
VVLSLKPCKLFSAEEQGEPRVIPEAIPYFSASSLPSRVGVETGVEVDFSLICRENQEV